MGTEKHVPLSDAGWKLSAAQVRSLGLKEGDVFSVSEVEDGVYLVVKQGEESAPASGRGKKMVLKGAVGKVLMADVFSLIHACRKTGILHISLSEEDATKSVYFKDGEIVFASSSLKEDRLGPSLLRAGKISPDQIEEASRELAPGKKIGKVLVSKGFITPKELWMGVRRQVEEIVSGLFRYSRGTFMFFEGRLDQENIVSVFIRTLTVMMEAIRKVREWPRVKERLPDGSVVLVKRALVPQTDLLPQEQSLLAMVDGVRTVGQICADGGMNESESYTTLYHLLQAGVLVCREGEKQEETGRGWSLDRCRAALETMNSIFMNVYSIISSKSPGTDVRKVLNSFFDDPAGEDAVIFQGISLDERGGLGVPGMMSRIEKLPDADRGPSFLTAMNELLSFELFELKHHLTGKEAEELMELVTQMQKGR